MAAIIVAAGCFSPAPTQEAPDDVESPAEGSVDVSREVGPGEGGPGDAEPAQSGNVSGQVVDDEVRPIAGAIVTLSGVQAQVRTTEDGLFEFQNVPAGRHVITVEAVGYSSESKAVDVRTDQRVDIVFELEALPVFEPHITSLPHTFIIHAGVFGTSLAGGNTTSCESCEWIPEIEPDPSVILVEIQGQHTVEHPLKPDGLAVFIYKNGNSDATIRSCGWVGADYDPPCLRLPIREMYNQTYLDSAEPDDEPLTEIRFWQWCDPHWVCVEERYDEWLTLFYDTPESVVPQDYSAFPEH